MESFLEAWDLICDYCKKQVTDVSYETWFSKLVPISLDFGAGVAIIQAPNEFNKSTIERGFHKCLNDAVQSVFGEAFTYKLITPMEKKEKERVPDDDEYEYTFETFIEGSSNKFACAACRYVAKEPAKNYNPLFIYGNSGLGKTHLMHAVGHALLQRNPDARVLYITSENFVNELITSIQTNRTTDFRNRFRSVDLLMVDDIQFIAGKESMQEEFFHTFNALYESSKQIILSSDKQPKEIPTLEERLRSRFEWGLIADIAKPDLETRIAILRRKAEQEKVHVPEEVNVFIASKIESNIRELEGSLNRVLAKSRLGGQPLSLELAQEALSEMLSVKDPRRITIDLITAVVAEYYNVTMDDIKSKKRNREISVPRQTAMYLCRELNGASLPRIGQEFGGRDHTTVMHAVEKLENDISHDPEVRRTVEDLKKRILGS